MYVIRDVFKAKAGKAKDLVAKFKSCTPVLRGEGIHNIRILTDVTATFWSVVWEFEAESVEDYFRLTERVDDPKVYHIMEGYHDYIVEGHREIFKIE